MNRKQFIYNTILATTGLSMPFNSVDLNKKQKKLTILHTNDMHSHIFPFKSGKYKGLGGMAERATLIKSIRERNDNVLLFDADVCFLFISIYKSMMYLYYIYIFVIIIEFLLEIQNM